LVHLFSFFTSPPFSPPKTFFFFFFASLAMMFSLESYSNKAPLACSLISRNKVSLLRFRVSADAVVDVVVVIVAGVFFFQSRASSAPIKTKKKDMKCRVVVFVSKKRMKWKTKERSLSL
jgi:hypothetical protein